MSIVTGVKHVYLYYTRNTLAGSLDDTIRVWNFRRGTQLTMFDTHYPVLGLAMTENADRIGVMLANNNNVPILCLHNSPARPKQVKSSENTLSVVSMHGSLVYGTNVSSSDSQQDLSGKAIIQYKCLIFIYIT